MNNLYCLENLVKRVDSLYISLEYHTEDNTGVYVVTWDKNLGLFSKTEEKELPVGYSPPFGIYNYFVMKSRVEWNNINITIGGKIGDYILEEVREGAFIRSDIQGIIGRLLDSISKKLSLSVNNILREEQIRLETMRKNVIIAFERSNETIQRILDLISDYGRRDIYHSKESERLRSKRHELIMEHLDSYYNDYKLLKSDFMKVAEQVVRFSPDVKSRLKLFYTIAENSIDTMLVVHNLCLQQLLNRDSVVSYDKFTYQESGIGVIRGLTGLIFFDISRCRSEQPSIF